MKTIKKKTINETEMLKKGILAVALALLFAGALAQKRQVMLDKVVAVVEARDGTILDVVRQIKPYTFDGTATP